LNAPYAQEASNTAEQNSAANPVATPPATTDNKESTPTTIAAKTPPPPVVPGLECPAMARGAPPHLVVRAKTKTGENYEMLSLGCIPLQETSAVMSEKELGRLDRSIDYLLGLKSVIRMYIDLEDGGNSDKEVAKKFREQAFEVKNYLTKKGVYDHLKANRELEFPPRFAETKPVPKSGAAPVKKVVHKRTPPPYDPYPDYTYHLDKKQVLFPNGEPEEFSGDKRNAFQFITLESIYFIHDKYELSDRAKTSLSAIANYLAKRTNPDRLILKGHADESGSTHYNYRLTDRRALAVRDYLTRNGVPAALIEIVSNSELNPVDENWSREGRSRNRRVELYLVQREEIKSQETTLIPTTHPLPLR
ncbi:MAG: peptidoglycan-associated lipoprotein, partial [Halothiobacillaceae bacterium]